MASSKPNENYFVSPKWHAWILWPAGAALIACAAFKPEAVPYDYIGPLKVVIAYLTYKYPIALRRICTLVFLIHCVEAYYAYKIARSKKINKQTALKWAVQTFIMGALSLRLINRYKVQRS